MTRGRLDGGRLCVLSVTNFSLQATDGSTDLSSTHAKLDAESTWNEMSDDFTVYHDEEDNVVLITDGSRQELRACVKPGSFPLVLSAAFQVPIRDVVQDAVLRDKALDDFEAAKEAEVQDLKVKSEARIAAIKDEIDVLLREKNAEIEGLKKAAEDAERAFGELQTRKRKEEDRLHEVVSHFIEGPENPITRRAASPPAPPKPDRA